MIVVTFLPKLLLGFLLGVVGRKVVLALAVTLLGLRVARVYGAGPRLRRAQAWLRAMRRRTCLRT